MYQCPSKCCESPFISLYKKEFDRLFSSLNPTQLDMYEMEEMRDGRLPDRIAEYDQSKIFWSVNVATGLIDIHPLKACPYLDPHKNNCTIYSHRPEACRNFKRGGLDCLVSQAKS